MKNIQILIIEDEEIAYKKLCRMLDDHVLDFVIVDWLQSVQMAKLWFDNHPSPDLIFLDIQLSDGLSFSIFENIEIDCPVIFTTAYEEHAIKAFELNSIDYLLKPFDAKALDKSIEKFEKRTHKPRSNVMLSHQLLALIREVPQYKERFHVKKANRVIILKVNDIAWFQLDSYVFVMTNTGQKMMLDYSLDQLMSMLDPKNFYRVNRQFIVNVNAIDRIEKHFSYKLKISVLPKSDNEVYVPKDKAKAFKEWLG